MDRRSQPVIAIAVCWGLWAVMPSGPAQAASIQVNGQWVNAGAGVRTGIIGSFLTYALPTDSMEQGY